MLSKHKLKPFGKDDMNMRKEKYTNTYTGEPVGTYVPEAFAKLKKPRNMAGIAKKIAAKYICKHCKSPMTWVEGTNIMTCKNEECPGLKVKDSKTGEIKTFPVYTKLQPWEAEILEKGL